MAGYTDYLDGYLARLWSITSSFGAFLDPVADKLMVSTTLILLSGLYGTLVSVPTAVIIAREIGVSALREWMSGRGMRETVKVGWQGKVKTALTMVSSTLLLAVDTDVISGVMDGVWKIGIFGLYASMVLTVTSGWGYFQAAKGELMKERKIGIFGLYASMVLTVTSGWGYFQAAKGELMKERKIGIFGLYASMV
eukprot:CAMPEP_0118643994 /NCGR_PEP_ID=MMETSP0785-20121206/6692_1 /TAXON_ID=91992 /ORGANISM="Bolidomonas pacifica, Strain CCMP 1866" /LENGTH=194 /DNA_ID=CAMNT_0006535703 /DNA_START=515 /DNA_END=1096 /DNA_ORIENTATION=-